ncbi:MAG: hypothetical protein LAP21_23590 [Acidobacteriia bacterium]|nr:hypothetical protein [Terriglobia bacterium]
MTKPSADILKLPLEVRAEMAIKAAFKGVVTNALRDGRSIHIWEDDKIVEVSSEGLRKILAQLAQQEVREPAPR